jgi:hypothetical protein
VVVVYRESETEQRERAAERAEQVERSEQIAQSVRSSASAPPGRERSIRLRRRASTATPPVG